MNLSQCRDSDAYLLSFDYPPIQACVSYLSAMILGGPFSLPLYSWRSQWVPFIARSIWAYVSPLSVLRTGSIQVENFFCTSGESNPRPWRWIKSTRDQRVKCNERRTRPCHRAYYIWGSTPFHSCVEVRSPKLVSSEDRTGARAPSASYCSTEGVAPLHTAPPVPVHCATSAGTLRHLFQGMATMTFTRSHTRPSQKDLGLMVNP